MEVGVDLEVLACLLREADLLVEVQRELQVRFVRAYSFLPQLRLDTRESRLLESFRRAHHDLQVALSCDGITRDLTVPRSELPKLRQILLPIAALYHVGDLSHVECRRFRVLAAVQDCRLAHAWLGRSLINIRRICSVLA